MSQVPAHVSNEELSAACPNKEMQEQEDESPSPQSSDEEVGVPSFMLMPRLCMSAQCLSASLIHNIKCVFVHVTTQESEASNEDDSEHAHEIDDMQIDERGGSSVSPIRAKDDNAIDVDVCGHEELAPVASDASCFTIEVGDRIKMPREDGSQFDTASVMALKCDGPAVLIYDDMMWVGVMTRALEASLRNGDGSKVSAHADVPSCQWARMFMSPCNGAPPDCFLYDEHAMPATTPCRDWRWFGRLVPAPEDGSHGQRYSSPRIKGTLKAGNVVKLQGRVTRLQPLKQVEPRELLTTDTAFLVLGFLQATLPAQKAYWMVVSTAKQNVKTQNIYAATMFGKGKNECHVTIVGGGDCKENLDAAVMLAKVCLCVPSLYLSALSAHLSARSINRTLRMLS